MESTRLHNRVKLIYMVPGEKLPAYERENKINNPADIIISLPLGTEVYCAPVRATVHVSSKAATSAGFDQREAGSNVVGMVGQLKR